jgi:hypothetical protein
VYVIYLTIALCRYAYVWAGGAPLRARAAVATPAPVIFLRVEEPRWGPLPLPMATCTSSALQHARAVGVGGRGCTLSQ